jgi:hypothetical protein
VCVAATGLSGVGLFSSAIASPPISGGRSSFFANDAARTLAVPSRPSVHQEHPLAALLDLRPPRDSAPTIYGAGALGSVSFPSAIHHSGLGKENISTAEGNGFHGSRIGELNFQTMSQSEILVRRVRREGLPVARLWDSKSALVSVGLNQRGKPGLWLTQKIH